jgi:hypothetical protein
MHFLFLTATIIGFLVIASLLFAGAYFCAVVIRTAIVSARNAAATVTPPELQLNASVGRLSGHGDAVHVVQAMNGEVN